MKTIIPLIEKTKSASLILNDLDVSVMNAVLHDMADALIEHQQIIINLNKQDVRNGQAMVLSPLALDRLHLDSEDIRSLSSFIRSLANNDKALILHDHENNIIDKCSTLAIVYESRPYMTAKAASLAFRSGHAIVLRGGKEAFHTNTAIASILCDVLEQNGLPRALINLIPMTDRVSMTELIGLKDLLDFVIPKGSEGLQHYISMNSKVPVLLDIPALNQ
jgi:glutamate-5-semialdehyde dehydrogenase